jgi:hypothetical protein
MKVIIQAEKGFTMQQLAVSETSAASTSRIAWSSLTEPMESRSLRPSEIIAAVVIVMALVNALLI